MPPSFCMQDHGPRKLRVAELYGLVFGSFSEAVPPLEEYLGEAILPCIERVLAGRKPVRARSLHPGASQQLEALHGERQGFLSRQHPASVLHDLRAEPPLPARRYHRRPVRRPPCELLGDRPPGREGRRVRQAEHPLRERLPARRPLTAAGICGVRRRHHAADPFRVPDLRAAADPELYCRAPDRAARHPSHRSQLDADRLSRTTRPSSV